MRSLRNALALLGLLAAPGAARAQSFADPGTGAGVHGSYSRSGDAASGFVSGGAQVRLRLTGGLGIEVLATYRQEEYASLGSPVLRVVEVPIVGSLQLFLLSSRRVQPYILAGGGYYWVRSTGLGANDAAGTATLNKFGLHAGAGVDVRVAQKTGVFADVRYVFLDVDAVKALGPDVRANFLHAVVGLNVYF